MPDGARRLGPVLWVIAALGVGAAFVAGPIASHLPDGKPVSVAGVAGNGGLSNGALARALAGRASLPTASGVQMPGRDGTLAVQVTSLNSAAATVAPLGRLHPADLLVVAPTSLPPGVAAAIRRLPRVTAVQPVDAATIAVNGKFIQMLGVNPGSFRGFAARPTARSTSLWRSVEISADTSPPACSR